MTQEKTQANYCHTHHTNYREDQQIAQRHEKYKPGEFLLLEGLDGVKDGGAKSYKHKEKSYGGNTEY